METFGDSAKQYIRFLRLIYKLISLGEKGIRKDIRIMVGGGPVTQEFSRRIGADGYAATAPAAAKLALKLMGQEGG